MRLSLQTLDSLASGVRRPAYDAARLQPGIVHLGLGAFHRAHQAVFTEDALERSGGDWGIIGVSMRRPDVAESLTPQDGLYTVETLAAAPTYRVIGAVRRTLTLPLQPDAVIASIAEPTTQIVTLTITEKGYCLAGEHLDLDHPDVKHDLAGPHPPRSAIGLLVRALTQRMRGTGAPITIVSCDNLANNGTRLKAAVREFADRTDPSLLSWLDRGVSFPETMVDCIVPAADEVSRARVDRAIGQTDAGSVQREPFAQWVIEDRFVAARPAWGAGVEFVGHVGDHRRLKLHVLNAAHSALAYLGQRRGHIFVRDAITDAHLARRVEAMILEEVAPALPELPVLDYWRATLARLANPMIDHRLDQIAQDGSAKLAERIYPLLQANLGAGRPTRQMASVVRAWLEAIAPGSPLDQALLDPQLFPESFRADRRLSVAVAEAQP